MTRLLFLSGNIQPIIFIIFSILPLRNGVFMLTNFNNRKKNRMHIGQLQAFILSMCLVTAGIFGLTGCSDASTNVNNTIYLETTKQTAGSDDTATLPADNESESGNPSDSTGEPENAGTSSDSTTAEASTEVTATVAPVSVNLIAVGDMLLHGGIHNSSLQPDGSYNYAHVFEHTKDRIAAADIAVANQEVILGGVELGVSSYPAFNSPQAFGDALVDTGFDVILHASNHTMDKDTVGVLNTIHFWKEKHPDTTFLGINENEDERDTIRIVEKDGIKIAMLNYTYGLNGFSLPADKPYLVNLMDDAHKTEIAQDMKNAREQADFVIVYPHWGTEYMLEATDEQKQWAQFFADNGADLIIGTHPHVVEPVEWITAANGRQTLVYYSLGNYISIQYYNYSMLGGFAEVTITKDSTGTYISDYDMDFLVTHYTAGRTEMTTYFLSDYTDELASRHAILTEPYAGQYAEGYRNVNQWYPFTVEGLWNLARQICPQFVK